MIGSLVDRGFSAWVERMMENHLPYPPSRTALLLVDLQRSFYDAAEPGAQLIGEVGSELGFPENVRRLVRECRKRGVTIVHCPFEVPADTEALELPYVQCLRDHGVLVEGSEGTEIPAALLEESDVVLGTRRLLNVFYGTDLKERLVERDVTHILVAGSVANAGVDSTGRMGVELEYDVTYVSDCIAALSLDEWKASVEVTFRRMAHRVLGSDEVLARENWEG